ncbi:unnamed protein product [Ectocarpus fasciculatus]
MSASWSHAKSRLVFGSGFRKILVVVKHSAYESYKALKAQGKAPTAVRWERLKNRHDIHRECVASVERVLTRHKSEYALVGREELDRQHISKVDLVISVGGDGTVLSASHFLGDNIPLVGVNSDPNRAEEMISTTKKTDERRSFGALCMCTALDVEEMLPKVLLREMEPQRRTRLQTSIKSTFTETKLPPTLNDLLLTNPNPAAVSRFRLGLVPAEGASAREWFNVWSSGMWVCTATGSTAAMKAAGGQPMAPDSSDLQYMVREHMVETHMEHLRSKGQGIVPQGSKIEIRWNSKDGFVYIDGEHSVHSVQLGDELRMSANAPPLYLYSKERPPGPGKPISAPWRHL